MSRAKHGCTIRVGMLRPMRLGQRGCNWERADIAERIRAARKRGTLEHPEPHLYVVGPYQFYTR